MKDIEIKIDVKEYGYEELPQDWRRLVEAARQATYRSYAPYSHFSVGAAVELENGEVIPGSNQENAAFSSGTCAERSACFYAAARYPESKFKAIAIAARGTDGKFIPNPISPCGACRQALLEYETLAGRPVPVLLASDTAVWVFPSVSSLLPLSFVEF